MMMQQQGGREGMGGLFRGEEGGTGLEGGVDQWSPPPSNPILPLVLFSFDPTNEGTKEKHASM